MKRVYILLFVIFSFLFPNLLTAQLSVKTDQATGKYAVGDTAFFVVQSASNSPISYAIKYDIGSNLPPFRVGQLTLDSGRYAFVPYVATTPGFVHFSVTQDAQSGYVGAAFDPFKIQPIEPEIANFDAFWMAQKAALAAIPLDANVQTLGASNFAFKFSFNIGLTDGKRVYGYINVPRGNGNYPAIIQMPAYGNVPNLVNDNVELAERAGVISVYLSIHSNVPTASGPENYLSLNLENPEQYYLKYAILGVIKTIDYLKTRTDFNGQVGVLGVSQGGGLAMLAAGIDTRISLLVSSYPALCGHSNLKYSKPSGFPYYWRIAQLLGLEPNTVLNTVKYYDAVTAVKRFKGVSWTMLSYLDDVCNSATIYEAFNQLKGQKILTQVFDKNHVQSPDEYARPDFNIGMYSFFRRHFPSCNNAPSAWLNSTVGYGIDAGKDTILTQNSTIVLRGSVVIENAPFNLPVRWEKVEGAGSVTFSNAQSLTTNATFSQAGIYRLRLVADDVSALTSDKKITTFSDDIVVIIGGLIPIELTNFSGKITEKGNEISWQTASEKGNKSFELERGEADFNWKLIAQINGKSNSTALNNYQFLDKEGPLSIIAYYRLKQIDFNGDFKYSKTISLQSLKAQSIQLFPNPMVNELTIKINDFTPPFEYKIYDVIGRIWLANSSNSNEIRIDSTELINGNYFIEIKNKAFTTIKQIIK